jgi:hypothetical protein
MPKILVENPYTWQTEFVELTDDELAAYKAADEFACPHPRSELRERVLRNKSRQHIAQCMCCGWAVGQAVKRDKKARISQWNLEIRSEWCRKQKSVRTNILCVAFDRKMQEDSAAGEKYAAYLKSDRWRDLRARVLQRDGGLCRGCFLRPAAEVHHMTYQHCYDEFGFELISLCAECHHRIHARIPDDRRAA